MRNKNQQNEKGESRKLRIKGSREKHAIFSIIILSFFSLILFMLPSIAQEASVALNDDGQTEKTPSHFYNVDREITLEGQVENLKFESRYENKGHFLILIIREKTSGELMEVETAPAWFFTIDIHKGENIRLIGSLTEVQQNGKKVVMAREIRMNNRTIILRDRRGFPAWAGGQGRKRGSPW